jgi:hypothetical protein
MRCFLLIVVIALFVSCKPASAGPSKKVVNEIKLQNSDWTESFIKSKLVLKLNDDQLQSLESETETFKAKYNEFKRLKNEIDTKISVSEELLGTILKNVKKNIYRNIERYSDTEERLLIMYNFINDPSNPKSIYNYNNTNLVEIIRDLKEFQRLHIIVRRRLQDILKVATDDYSFILKSLKRK